MTHWADSDAPLRAPLCHRLGFRRRAFAERLFLALAARIQTGALSIELPDGSTRVFKGRDEGPSAALQIRDPRVFRRVLLGGSLAFADAYIEGACDSPDLAALVECVAANEAVLLRALDTHGWIRLLPRLGHLLRPNSRRGAERNIARHYDLGNDFYALWLDPSMTYSAALFERPGQSLEEAQHNKYRRITALAGVQPGDHVLEVGCGWGGFCTWAAREIGCRVTAITISRAQHAFAARRVQAEGLADRVDLRLQDYRDVEGQFDKIVSIEMLEAVGEKYWPRYFAMLHDRLTPGGRAALQVITIDDALFGRYRRGVDFIQRHIFPGGLLPSPAQVRRQVRGAGLSWQSCDAFGSDYARTLALWRRAFEEAWSEVSALGFDERFRRMWRYYLSYCEAGFNSGRIDVMQVALCRS